MLKNNSNQLMLLLSLLTLVFYISNLAYHKFNYEKNLHTYNPKDVFDNKKNRIKVVKITDNQLRATNKITILKRDKSERTSMGYAMSNKVQVHSFYKSCRYSNDTLFILADSIPVQYPQSGKSEMKITLNNVEKVFYNNNLISEF